MSEDLRGTAAAGGFRALGRPRLLTPEQDAGLQVAMRDARPNDLGLSHPAWSRAAIKDLLEAKTGRVLNRRSVDAYALRWGFKREAAYQTALRVSPDSAAKWLDNEYRALAVRIGAKKGRLRWLVIRGLPPIETPHKQGATTLSKTDIPHVEVRLETRVHSRWVICRSNDADALKASVLHMLSLDSEYEQKVIVLNCLRTSIDEALDECELVKVRVSIEAVFGKTERPRNTERAENLETTEGAQSIDLSTTEQRVVLRGGQLALAYRSRSSGKTKDWTLDLNEFWLPKTPFSDKPLRLSEEPRLCNLMVAAANEFLTASRRGKSMPTTLSAACRTVAKLFEWSWLNGMYDPTRLTQTQFDALLLQLSKSGWVGALEMAERVRSHLVMAGPEGAERLLGEQRSRRSASLSLRCQSILGTCLTAREMALVKPLIVSIADRKNVRERTPNPRWKGSSEGMGYSMLRQTLSTINLLAGLDDPTRVPFVPYPNTRKRAAKYGRPGGRTPNLRPEHVGRLLLESMKLIRYVGPPLARLLGEYIDRVESSPPRPGRFDPDLKLLKSCQSYAQTAEALGWDITRWLGKHDGSNESNTSLHRLIRDVYTAASTVIIFMNARRRDEVEHPEIGLFNGALREFDPALDLHIVDFYIEKSLEDYATFFVSDFTVEAIRLLEQLSGLARRWRKEQNIAGEAAKGHSMLLELPTLLPAGREQRQMFNYACNINGHAYHFVTSVLGPEMAAIFGAHMGRRAYALIYHYRFEEGTLLGLAHQFGSVAVERLLTYVTDGPHQLGGFKAHQLGGKATANMRSNLRDVIDLEGELELVSKERVEELVHKVLMSGKAQGGPFQKLILRLHQMLVGRVEYKLMEPKDSVKTVAKALIDRGHRATPYAHGNCYARMSSKGGQARCKDPKSGIPDRANASLHACTGCAYHDHQVAHIKATEEFIGNKIERVQMLNGSSVQVISLRKEIEDDQKYLGIRKRRLGLIA